eukprot:TRINITY_DN22305_c0_g1_i1.p1 TRINITY_DN22305_c0_g1~~TRINITY_DN22305_c0_g1_i1.p1  ORF type:complete len:508 (+),score=100.70 TRINITY_DN22305_c0_g1_i1:135-1658(+)
MQDKTAQNIFTQTQPSQQDIPSGSFPMKSPPDPPRSKSVRLFSLDDEDEDEEIFIQIRAIKSPLSLTSTKQKNEIRTENEQKKQKQQRKHDTKKQHPTAKQQKKEHEPIVLAPESPRTQKRLKVPLDDLTIIESSDDEQPICSDESDSDSPAIQQVSSDDDLTPSIKKRRIENPPAAPVSQSLMQTQASQSTIQTQSSQVTTSQPQWANSQIPSSQSVANIKKIKQMNLSQFWKSIPAPEVSLESVNKDKWQPNVVKIPPKISMALARTIRNYRDPATQCKRSSYWEGYLQNFNFKSEGNRWAAILLDPPWGVGRGQITPKALKRMNQFPQLIENGFIFIWIEKELTMEIANICQEWGFKYVENVVWLKQKIDFEPYIESSTYFNKRKMTLHIWRKGGKDLDLRHQRNPDVVFDFVRKDKNGREDKPEFIYEIIETLLPTPKGWEGPRFIEFWAKRNQRREGWRTVCFKDDMPPDDQISDQEDAAPRSRPKEVIALDDGDEDDFDDV